jgi:two-component system sensor histidine kinase LytS
LKHGILPKEDKGEITISAHRDNGLVRICVKDNGVGMAPDRVKSLFSEKPKGSGRSGSGIALKNVQMRLSALYGADHPLKVESAPNQGTAVSFTIPYGGNDHESLHH